ncbi:MAG: 30S ribosomal protein S5 [Candidatus Aenigmatarchaeota archaeon]
MAEIEKETREEKSNEAKILEAEEVKEIEKVPIEEIPEEIHVVKEEALEKWQPKTQLGREVFEGKITDIDEILQSGRIIKEFEIVDKLVPNLKNELITIGGRTGKGGGVQRIPIRITTKMTKSGRRFNYSSFVVVGNEDGLVGIGKGVAPEPRDAINKAIQKAKLNIIRVKRGCGSWECSCDEPHSIPYKVKGKSGSVRVELYPAPKGLGIVADDESKKILRLAGIKDVWVKTFGNTSMRINLITAIYDAFKKLNIYDKMAS